MRPDLVLAVQQRLNSLAEPATKEWWDRYLRNAIEFRGVKMASIRRAVAAILDQHDLHAGDAATKELAFDLLEAPMAEDKLAGVLLMAERLLPDGHLDCGTDLHRIAAAFDSGAIDDWNTCDWLCVKVLGPLALHRGQTCAEAIAAWHTAPGIWRSRAAAVAFVNLLPATEEPIPGLRDLVLEACAANVQRHERFAQTGVGWAIRELSRGAPGPAERFITDHLADFSREAVRSATAKLPDAVRDRLLADHRAATGR